MARDNSTIRDEAEKRFTLREHGDAISFSGALAQYIDVPDKSKYSFVERLGTFTAIGIYMPQGSNLTSGILGSTVTATEKGCTFFVNGQGNVSFAAYNGSGTRAFIGTSAIKLPANPQNKPFLIIVSCTNGGNLKFNIGDFKKRLQAESKSSGLGSLSSGNSTNNLYLGRSSVGFGPCRGYLLMGALLEQDLTDKEKEIFYKDGQLPEGVTGSIFKNFDQNKAIPTQIDDSGSFANNGTLSGTPSLPSYITNPFPLLLPRSVADIRANIS